MRYNLGSCGRWSSKSTSKKTAAPLAANDLISRFYSDTQPQTKEGDR